MAPQSLGGEDFGWYLDRVPGAMMRLGHPHAGRRDVRPAQGNLRVDERAVASARKLLAVGRGLPPRPRAEHPRVTRQRP